MLDLALFRNKAFSGANAVMLLVGLAMFGVFFYVSLYVQQVLGYSPIQAGAAFLPWTLLIILLAPQAGRLSDRIGPRPFVTGGMVVLSGVADRLLAPGRARDLLGPAARHAARRRRDVGRDGADRPRRRCSSVRPDKAGVGSAVLNSMRQVGGSLGIAIMGAIVAASDDWPGGDPIRPASSHGFHHALVTAAGADAARRGDRRADARRAAHSRARAEAAARRSRMSAMRPRLPAEERRAAVLDTACRVFAAV